MEPSKEELQHTMDFIITQLLQEGLIDEYFKMAMELKEVRGPTFFLNLLDTFVTDAQNHLLQLSAFMEEQAVNFSAVFQLAIKLKGSTSCIGACSVARACSDLRRAAEENNRQRCMEALTEMNQQFKRLKPRLDAILKLERKIIDSSTS